MTKDELRAWLARVNLTPSAAARELGVHRATVLRWLKGDRKIGPVQARALAALERKISRRRSPSPPEEQTDG